MKLVQQDTDYIYQPLLKGNQNKPEKVYPKLQNKRKSKIFNPNQPSSLSKKSSIQSEDGLVQKRNFLKQQLVHSISDILDDPEARNYRNQSTVSVKKSIKVQFNKNRNQQRKKLKDINSQTSQAKLLQQKRNLNQSIYSKLQLQGLRIRTNWKIPVKSRQKSFNSQIMSLNINVQKFLYYMNFLLNAIFRLALLSILTLMIVYEGEYKLMEMVVIMEVVCGFLYCLAMIKMLYTKKQQQCIYFQKNFTDRDITDIEMDRVLRKHFTWRNILKNVSAYFKLNTKFKQDIKISIIRQQIFKRMQIVLCFIPFTVIFFTTPNIFRFECDYPVEIIVTATICLQFVRMTVHYIVIFIQN